MAYNFLCETTTEPHWKKLNIVLRKYDRLEVFPLLEASEGKYALAVSIPMKNVGDSAYRQFVKVYRILTKRFQFTVYDLYYGTEVDRKQIEVIRREIS